MSHTPLKLPECVVFLRIWHQLLLEWERFNSRIELWESPQELAWFSFLELCVTRFYYLICHSSDFLGWTAFTRTKKNIYFVVLSMYMSYPINNMMLLYLRHTHRQSVVLFMQLWDLFQHNHVLFTEITRNGHKAHMTLALLCSEYRRQLSPVGRWCCSNRNALGSVRYISRYVHIQVNYTTTFFILFMSVAKI